MKASQAARRSGWKYFKWRCFRRNFLILDETDSGLDIDALRIVSDGVNALRSPDRAMLVITHYQRLLDYIKPDRVHVQRRRPDRSVRRSRSWRIDLEKNGYERYEQAA